MVHVNFNKDGNPYSKKQRKASRHMMAMRNGRPNRQAAHSNFSMDSIGEPGLMAGLMAALFMGRRKSR